MSHENELIDELIRENRESPLFTDELPLPLLEHSAAKIGRVWMQADHDYLVHVVAEVERTAQAMVKMAIGERAE